MEKDTKPRAHGGLYMGEPSSQLTYLSNKNSNKPWKDQKSSIWNNILKPLALGSFVIGSVGYIATNCEGPNKGNASKSNQLEENVIDSSSLNSSNKQHSDTSYEVRPGEISKGKMDQYNAQGGFSSLPYQDHSLPVDGMKLVNHEDIKLGPSYSEKEPISYSQK